ncbi:hypothetical protein [Arenimonas sp.]|uniref:hypothetical protein n=1 Tax=Arenimonas sp. TaxID=1872635 RepID=UPI0035B35F9F
MSLRIPLATVALALCTACSPSSDQHDAPSAANEAAPAASQADGQASATAARTPKPQGDCDLLSAAEINGAFEGRLSVRRAGGHGARGSGCTYDLAEGDEAQLILQAGNRAAFDMRKENYADMPLEKLDLGEEAWLVNNAQVIAVSADGDSISLGLQLFTFGKPTPVDPAQARAGLESLARTALERM